VAALHQPDSCHSPVTDSFIKPDKQTIIGGKMAETRYLGVAEETTYGTLVSPTAYLDIRSESVEPSRDFLFPVTVAARERQYKGEGPFRESGSIELFVEPVNFGYLLKWFFGDVSTDQPDAVGAPNTYRHRFTPQPAIKSFSAHIGTEIEEAGTAQKRAIHGMFINSMRIEAVARELVVCSLDVTAEEEEVAAVDTPTFPDERFFAFGDGSVTVAGGDITARVEAFRLTLENDIDTDAFVLGSIKYPGIRLQGFNCTGEMELAFLDWDEHKRFLGGATLAAQSDFAAELKLTGDAIEAGYNFQLRLDLPRIHYTSSHPPIEERNRIVQRVAFQALKDATAGYSIRAELINKQTSY